MGKLGSKTNVSAAAKNKREADKIATTIRMGGPRKIDQIFRLKAFHTARELAVLFPQSIRNRNHLNSFHGEPFPKSIGAMFDVPAYGRPATAEAELAWGLLRASLYSNELSDFVKLRESFEKEILLGNRVEANNFLIEIENRFGWSLWLIQNRLTTTQIWDGLEEKRALAVQYLDEAPNKRLTNALINFIGRRSEATGLKNYLQVELTKFLGNSKSPLLDAYIKTKLFDLGSFSVNSIAPTLLFEAQFSLVDHYETLILILQAVSIGDSLPETAIEAFSRILHENCANLQDVRVKALARTFRKSNRIDKNAMPEDRCEIIEQYSIGNYETVIEKSFSYLSSSPNDIAICTLRAKGIIASKLTAVPLPGMLGELERLLVKLLELGPDTYGAAFAIYTLHERFYGHPWAVFALAVMNDTLAKESIEYPRKTYKFLLAIDYFVTPFTVFSMHRDSRSGFLASSALQLRFKETVHVVSALTVGTQNHGGDNLRIAKYHARYLLNSGDFKAASSRYSQLMASGTIADRFRFAACGALAFLACDEFPQAVEMVVDGAIINKEVPTILPIKEVAHRLDLPSDWPDTISLPILFELYHRYVDKDKTAHMRLAFERFQSKQNIVEPEDLVARIEEFKFGRVVEYLDKVWHPETMRQTLLYENPKQIEDARISVCRTLAEIDPENSPRYLEEIRDRVKRQEIAKGTSMVEQSKVYVDIYAIKKTLNGKLGDTYTRYKNAIRSNPIDNDDLMEKIADVVSHTTSNASLSYHLSKLHLLDYKESELDLQFTALFSEVTNEFLRGDHGLNAYLSTRVRHGTLANTLRKPLADEHIVTSLNEDESAYLPNSYWGDKIKEVGELDQQMILSALEDFSRSIDKINRHLNNEVLQIRVSNDLPLAGPASDALFIYVSSNIERKFIQEYDKKIVSIEQFIDRCVESLWEKTDMNLANVRRVMEEQVRNQYIECFDNLAAKINTVHGFNAVGEISNAIARARTDFHAKFKTVCSWFRRSEVYDRADYHPEYAVQIALNMVEKTLPKGSNQLQMEINNECGSATMPGRTLDAMVDVFACLFDNAVMRSGIPLDTLIISVKINLIDSKFSAVVINNTANDKPGLADIEKLSKVRESLKKNDSRARAQREGGSGLHKIWRAITSPIYKDPFLDFEFKDSVFLVAFTYRLEVSEDENIVN